MIRTIKYQGIMSMIDKHRAFVEEYLINGYNATLAYQKAYPTASKLTATASGARLLTKDNIREYIEAKKKEIANKCIITKEEVLQILVDIAKDKDNKNGDRIKATTEINKMGGFYAPTETHVNMNVEQKLFNDIDLDE
jgi:phage terminase small subunit